MTTAVLGEIIVTFGPEVRRPAAPKLRASPLLTALARAGTLHVYADTADRDELARTIVTPEGETVGWRTPMTTRPTLDRKTVSQIEAFLRDRRVRLQESLRARVAERRASDATWGAEQATNAVEALRTDLEVSMLDRASRQAVEIDSALERLAQGQYGMCRDCGEFIGLGRLRALPFAQRCTACQTDTENRERLVHHAREPQSIRPGARRWRRLDRRHDR
jgi:DnaK suppressor protein